MNRSYVRFVQNDDVSVNRMPQCNAATRLKIWAVRITATIRFRLLKQLAT